MIRLGTLDGRWRFKTGENPGDYTLPTLDDSSWDTILVPAHWHNEGYPHFSGEGWYRTHFESPSRAEGDRLGLRFAAVDYWAHVWLNGIDLGEHEGYFAPFMFDITPHLSPSGDNVLVVQVRNPPDVANLIKGAVTRWDCSDPNGNPGGIWKSVELLAITPTEFTSVSTRTTLVAGDLPILHLTAAVNHGRETVAAALRISLVPQNFQGRTFVFEKRVGIHPGEQELCFDFELPDAALSRRWGAAGSGCAILWLARDNPWGSLECLCERPACVHAWHELPIRSVHVNRHPRALPNRCRVGAGRQYERVSGLWQC